MGLLLQQAARSKRQIDSVEKLAGFPLLCCLEEATQLQLGVSHL